MNERDAKPAPDALGSVEQDRIVMLSDGVYLRLLFCRHGLLFVAALDLCLWQVPTPPSPL